MKKLQCFQGLAEARTALQQANIARPFSAHRARALLHRPRSWRKNPTNGVVRFPSFQEARQHSMGLTIERAINRPRAK